MVRHLTIYVHETHLRVLRLLLSHYWFLCTKWPNHELRLTYTRYITQDYHNCIRNATSRFQHSALTQQCNVTSIRTSGMRCCNMRTVRLATWTDPPLLSVFQRVSKDVISLGHIRTCFYARCYLRVQLMIFARRLSATNNEQLVDLSA
jgi:hypothetical protein